MIIPTGYAQTNFIFTGAGVPEGAEVTLGWDIGGAGGDPEDLNNALDAAWGTANIDNAYTSDVILTGLLTKFGPNATGPSHLKSVNHPGAQATSGATPQVATLWHKTTALGGRAGRGRLYLPGVPENAVSSAGVLDNAFVVAHAGVWNALLTAMALGSYDGVVLHGAGSPISTPTPITTINLQSKVATQRRRLRP